MYFPLARFHLTQECRRRIFTACTRAKITPELMVYVKTKSYLVWINHTVFDFLYLLEKYVHTYLFSYWKSRASSHHNTLGKLELARRGWRIGIERPRKFIPQPHEIAAQPRKIDCRTAPQVGHTHSHPVYRQVWNFGRKRSNNSNFFYLYSSVFRSSISYSHISVSIFHLIANENIAKTPLRFALRHPSCWRKSYESVGKTGCIAYRRFTTRLSAKKVKKHSRRCDVCVRGESKLVLKYPSWWTVSSRQVPTHPFTSRYLPTLSIYENLCVDARLEKLSWSLAVEIRPV